ncbi:hypothetical protein NST99_17525 [Paenibacillus sp. FSL L8-0470]|uniref:hypothetical protein n=1 Tax=unclassified Paenibacillus TaxID=185978 RepID=UPI0030FBA314
MRKSLFLIIPLWLASTFFAIWPIHADWAYNFVVNDGKSYIISDNQVEKEQIGSIIGKVTSFSDKEGTYSGNFSNYYPKGTEYYNIKDLDKNEAIAIKINDGSFIKANYEGEYAGSRFDWEKVLWYSAGLILLVLVIVIVIVFVKNNWKRI